MAYRKKRGNLNPMLRTDRTVGMLTTLYANTHRDKKQKPEAFRIYDFIPHEDEPAISLEQAMEQWQ